MAGRKRKVSFQHRVPYKGLEWVEKECAGERKQLYLSSDTKTTLYNTSVFSAGTSLRNAPRKKTKSSKVRIGLIHGKCCFGANLVLEKSHAAPFVYSRHAMPTRAITTAAARNAVLHTRELLEAIIHHLPMSDVLNLRSVCSTWKYTIDDSVSLQRKLFLKAVHTGDLWVTDTHTSTMRPSSSKQIREISEQNPMESRYLVARPSQLNATFFARKPGHEKTPILHRAKYCERLSFTEQPDQIKHNTIWQSMFICQPAVKAVHIYLRYSGRLYNQILRFWYMDDQELRIEVVNEVEGIRYKDVVAAIHAAIETKHAGRDAAEFEIRVSDEHQRTASEVYMLGALFASGEEIKAVEELQDQEWWSEETSQFIRGMEREPSLFLSEGPVGLNRTG